MGTAIATGKFKRDTIIERPLKVAGHTWYHNCTLLLPGNTRMGRLCNYEFVYHTAFR
jgi:hypothetical protein